MEGQEPRVCKEEEVVPHPDKVEQHEEKRFKSLWQEPRTFVDCTKKNQEPLPRTKNLEFAKKKR